MKIPKLTIEQEFEYQALKISVNNFTKEQTVELLIMTVRMLMIKDNIIKELLKEKITGTMKNVVKKDNK